ncbi:MAG TPA: hypothetical protein VMS79_01365, partial [Methanomassiliicoccales archaeon]|nr:hypothetical protein [Methanomassiliicoccales archaeon]
MVGLGYDVQRSWLIPKGLLDSRDHLDGLSDELDSLLQPDRRYVVMPDAPALDGFVVESDTSRSIVDILQGGDRQFSSWAELLESVTGRPYGLVIQEVPESDSAGAASSFNPLTGDEDVVIEFVGASDKNPELMFENEQLERIVIATRQAAESRGRPICLWWTQSKGRLRWRRLLDAPRHSPLMSYSTYYSGSLLPGISKPLEWSIDSDLVGYAWHGMLREVFDVVVDPAFLFRRFYGRSYVNVALLRRAARASGLSDRAIDALMIHAPRKDGFSIELSLDTVAFLPRIARWIGRSHGFENS